MALILREAVRQLAIGMVVGLAVAAILAGRMGTLLFHVSPRDPVVAVVAMAVLIGSAVLTAMSPAYTAMAIDPMTAIREE
jgi:hypothetical protein